MPFSPTSHCDKSGPAYNDPDAGDAYAGTGAAPCNLTQLLDANYPWAISTGPGCLNLFARKRVSKLASGLGLTLLIIGFGIIAAKYIYGIFTDYPWALLALLLGLFLRWLGGREHRVHREADLNE